jgi:hypothetical protein
VLRISQKEGCDVLTMMIEGKVVGEWTAELERAWTTILSSLGTKKLCVDICGVTYLDQRGREILREIFMSTGAQILADSPLTKQFAEEARQ